MNNKNPIHALRLLKGLSQDELAEKVFVTRQAVSRWESETCYPDIESLPAIADFFGVLSNLVRRCNHCDSFIQCIIGSGH